MKKKIVAASTCQEHGQTVVLTEDGAITQMARVQDGDDLRGRKLTRIVRRDDEGYDLETVWDGTHTSGPAQVATKAYRTGWDSVFGQSRAN